MANEHYTQLLSLIKRAGLLSSVSELLEWDQEVMMPDDALTVRAQEKGVVAALQHEIFTSDAVGECLKHLETAKLDEDQAATVREVARNYHRLKSVPSALVQQLEEARSHAVEVWRGAREKKDFSLFAPALTELVELTRKYALAIDAKADPYETLLGDYEDDMGVEDIHKHFTAIKEHLVPLIEKVKAAQQPDDSVLKTDIAADKQVAFLAELTKNIGYDFGKGRLDTSTHPFTACYGRITTRFTEGWFEAVTSTMHEAGHAMYEHGLPLEHYGTPLGQFRSMSVHESQSRLWENHVGKSQPFWEHYLADAQKAYAPLLDGVDIASFYKMINRAEPGFIRVQADELTYTLHIIIRFELESALIQGTLKVEDLPAKWNEKMQNYLGITPADDAQGVLQDTHWASGLFGYFPTYTLGTMMSAQIYEAAKRALPKLESDIAAGNCTPLLQWLRENIHTHGCRYPTKELIKRATGKQPAPDDYIKYLEQKFTTLYNL